MFWKMVFNKLNEYRNVYARIRELWIRKHSENYGWNLKKVMATPILHIIVKIGQWVGMNKKVDTAEIYTFKYHVSCTDGKISVRIIYFYYLIFHRRPTHKLFSYL